MFKITAEAAAQIMQAEKMIKEFEETSTLNILRKKAPGLIEKISSTLSKYKDNLNFKNLSRDEVEVFKEYIITLQNEMKYHCRMAKVIPQSQIKDYINLDRDLQGCFIRHADLISMTSNSDDCFSTVYKNLRLDYENTCFDCNTDNYMGVIVTRFNNFSIRVPLIEDFAKELEDYIKRIVISNDNIPFTGTGFTASEFGVPEFYVSITNKKGHSAGAFPLLAFSSEFYLIQRNSEIIKFGVFCSGDHEFPAGDRFTIYNKYSTIADTLNISL